MGVSKVDFSRYTEAARQAVVLAQDQAILSGNEEIFPVDLTRGLVAELNGLASRALRGVGILALSGEVVERRQLPFADATRRILDEAPLVAFRLRENCVGTEHLLVALLEDESAVGVFGALLVGATSATPEKLKRRVFDMLSGPRSIRESESDSEVRPSVECISYDVAREGPRKAIVACIAEEGIRGLLFSYDFPSDLCKVEMSPSLTGIAHIVGSFEVPRDELFLVEMRDRQDDQEVPF